MPALLIPLGVVLIAMFALSSYLTAVEQQRAQAPEIDTSGFMDALRSWRYFIPAPIALAGAGAKKLTNAILSRYAAAKLVALAKWFTGLWLLVAELDRQVLGLSRSTADALDYQTKVATPRAIDRRVRPVNRKATKAAAVAGAAAVGATRWGRDVSRDVDHSERIGEAARKKARAAAQSATKANAATRINGRDITGIRRRVKALEKPITAAAAAAVLALGFKRLGFRFWRCSAFKRVGRSLNCTHFSFLDDLLFAAIVPLAVFDICRIASYTESAAETVAEPLMRQLVGVTDFVCTGRGGLPSGVEARPGYSGSWLPSGV